MNLDEVREDHMLLGRYVYHAGQPSNPGILQCLESKPGEMTYASVKWLKSGLPPSVPLKSLRDLDAFILRQQATLSGHILNRRELQEYQEKK